MKGLLLSVGNTETFKVLTNVTEHKPRDIKMNCNLEPSLHGA